MSRLFVFLVFAVAACKSDAPVTPPATPAPVYCGAIPHEISKCLGNPKIINEAPHDCQTSKTVCDRLTCVFQISGWLEGGKVKKAAVIAHFDQFAKDHPDWSKAVQQVKSLCLAGDLPWQGVYTYCAPYDVTMCSLGVFFTNAQPSQWSTSQECAYARQYAAACPMCPSDCFAPAIPVGSCNACLRRPKSP